MLEFKLRVSLPLNKKTEKNIVQHGYPKYFAKWCRKNDNTYIKNKIRNITNSVQESEKKMGLAIMDMINSKKYKLTIFWRCLNQTWEQQGKPFKSWERSNKTQKRIITAIECADGWISEISKINS